jgi:transcriptional regulator with XRE-family HTH domain
MPPISGAQLCAARALLNWSVRELSARCGISRSAIARAERMNDTPPMQPRNLNAIRRVFEAHGIEFLGFDGAYQNERIKRALRESCVFTPNACSVFILAND